MAVTRLSVSLALQGGGAHGAFTWGVLDRLLEDGRFEFAGITGTSAGAMNAVALAAGLCGKGADGARENLERLWSAVSARARLNPVRRSPLDAWLGSWSLDHSAGFAFFDAVSHWISPYDVNPLGLNPLRQIIDEVVDFDRLCSSKETKLFVAATNVRTGAVRVFRNEELSADAVLASACLPAIFNAVEIDGEEYWDGGYSGNPVMFPYLYECDADDVIIVQINPMERQAAPKTARQISNRVDEITFNASMMRELRALEFVTDLARNARLPHGLRPLRVHRIDADEQLRDVSASSRLNAEAGFVRHLFSAGREAGEVWLDKEACNVGVRSGIDPSGSLEYLPQVPPVRKFPILRRKSLRTARA